MAPLLNSSRVDLGRDVAAGAVAGAIATVAMSGLMLGGQELGLLGKQPPRMVSDAILDRVPGRKDETTRRIGTTFVHLAIGAVAGGVQQVARDLAARPQPAIAWGAGSGAALWALNYIVLAPSVGLIEPPHRDRPGRPLVMFAANVLWGGLTAVIGDRLVELSPRDPASRR